MCKTRNRGSGSGLFVGGWWHPRYHVDDDLAAPFQDIGAAWGKSHQSRPLKLACDAPSIVPSIGLHGLRHTVCAQLAMAGVPIGVIAAQLGQASVTITAKHYAHLSPSYVADTIRSAARPQGPDTSTNLLRTENAA